jgi:hypothetical protein
LSRIYVSTVVKYLFFLISYTFLILYRDYPLDVSESLLETEPGGLFSVRVGTSILADNLPADSVLGCEISLPGTAFVTREELIHRPTSSKYKLTRILSIQRLLQLTFSK